MKLIRNILISTLLIGFASCDTILDEPIYSFKTTSNSFLTESDAFIAITNCYFQLDSYLMYSQQYWRLLESASGGITRARYVTGNDDIELISKKYLSTNNSISDLWTGHYLVINTCNDALEGVSEMNNIKPEVKNSVIGEALFLRSMHYFNLVRIWGGHIPLRLNSTKGLGNAYTGPSTEEAIYTQILADLKKAAQLMPATQTLKGRATKGAANALIAKVYLTLGSMKKYGEKYTSIADTRFDFVTNPDAFYDSTRVYCQKVIGSYTLPNDYASQFVVATKNSTESIFEVQFTTGIRGSGNQIAAYVCPYTYGSCFSLGYATHRLTKKQYNDFNTAHPGDYRLESSIFGGFIGRFSQYTAAGVASATGDLKKDSIFVWPNPKASTNEKWPYLYKFRDPAGTAANQHGNNFIYLRYADVLLMAAEAENEIGNTETACGYVDQLMARARNANGTPRTTPTDWTGTSLSRDQIRLNIWNERHFELLGEVHLWYDLIRTGQYAAYLKDHNDNYYTPFPTSEYEMLFLERNILFPIPNNELNQNNLLTQNFGY